MFIVKCSLLYPASVRQDQSLQAIASNVATLLRDERKRQGLSMDLLAEKAGLSQSMISLVERDLRNPTLDTLLRISQALKLDLAEVIRQATDSAR